MSNADWSEYFGVIYNISSILTSLPLASFPQRLYIDQGHYDCGIYYCIITSIILIISVTMYNIVSIKSIIVTDFFSYKHWEGVPLIIQQYPVFHNNKVVCYFLEIMRTLTDLWHDIIDPIDKLNTKIGLQTHHAQPPPPTTTTTHFYITSSQGRRLRFGMLTLIKNLRTTKCFGRHL